MTPALLYWRRIDVEGLERMALSIGGDGVTVTSTIICVGDGGFRVDHRWHLDSGWRAASVIVERWNARGQDRVQVERCDGGWRVDGVHRPDLDGAEEPDLSVTPFCNTLPIRRTPTRIGESLTLDVAYIDGATLAVTRSRQRYDRQGPQRLRFVDLGLSKGFEAELVVDDEGLIVSYEHLFERVYP